MHARIIDICFIFCLFSILISLPILARQEPSLVLRGGTLIDGTGQAPVSDAVVVVRGRRIVAIGRLSEVSVPKNAQVVDARGKWIIPGLIDAHAHFGTGFVASNHIVTPDLSVRSEIARNYLRYGVTTIYVMADDPDRVLSDKKRIAEGSMVGPRIFAAGPAFTVPGSHPTQVASAEMPLALASNDPEQMKRMVREVAKKGVDYIKIAVEGDIPRPGAARMPPQIIAAVVEEARRNGLLVGCHCTSIDEATDAVNAGVKVLIHWVGSDHGPITQDFIDLLKSRGIPVIPTLGVRNAAALYASDPRMIDDPEFVAFAGKEMIEQVKTNPWWKEWMSSSKQLWQSAGPDAIENIKKLHRGGVTIGFGTDTSVRLIPPGYSVALEMDLMQRAGMTPMEILVAATQTNSKILGHQDQIGALAPGKLADLIILEANPLQNVYNIRKIYRVVKEGKMYDPYTLGSR